MDATTAEQLTGWGTVVLAVGTLGTLTAALTQLRNERDARRAEQHERAEMERRRQADAVSAWYAGDDAAHRSSFLEMVNRSNQPVYQVAVSLAFVQGAAPRTTEEWASVGGGFRYTRCAVALPPGRYRVEIPAGWGALSVRPGAEIGFTDVHGNSWVRRANGALDELPTNAIDAFGISRPIDFVPLARVGEGGAAVDSR